MDSAAVCTHCNATEIAMKPLTTHEEFCLKNAAHRKRCSNPTFYLRM